MQKYIRELEQKNDNLEQTNRCAMFSLGEFESKLNEALERNSILEMELDDKDELAETVQRLRDEARDLKQEIAVRQQKAQKTTTTSTSIVVVDPLNNVSMDTDSTTITNNNNNNNKTNSSALNTILNELQLISQQTTNQFQSQQQQQPQIQQQQQHSQQQQLPVTPSIRISALNFVGDALRKVTSMESRLVAARNLMKESNRDRRSATISNTDNNNVSRLVS